MIDCRAKTLFRKNVLNQKITKWKYLSNGSGLNVITLNFSADTQHRSFGQVLLHGVTEC